MSENNTVYVGNKSLLAYVLAATTLFAKNDEIHIKARGKAMAKAIDVAEIIKRRFENVKTEVTIGTEELEREGKKKPVSVIDIKLVKS